MRTCRYFQVFNTLDSDSSLIWVALTVLYILNPFFSTKSHSTISGTTTISHWFGVQTVCPRSRAEAAFKASASCHFLVYSLLWHFFRFQNRSCSEWLSDCWRIWNELIEWTPARLLQSVNGACQMRQTVVASNSLRRVWSIKRKWSRRYRAVSYTHLRAHETA